MEEEESEAAEAAEELEHRLDKGSTGCSALLFVAEEEEEAEEEAAASVVVDDAANRDETVLVVLCGMCEESHILVSKHKAKNEETPTKMKGGRKSEWDGEGGWWKEEEEEEEKKKKRRDVHTHTHACLLVQTEKKKGKWRRVLLLFVRACASTHFPFSDEQKITITLCVDWLGLHLCCCGQHTCKWTNGFICVLAEIHAWQVLSVFWLGALFPCSIQIKQASKQKASKKRKERTPQEAKSVKLGWVSVAQRSSFSLQSQRFRCRWCFASFLSVLFA